MRWGCRKSACAQPASTSAHRRGEACRGHQHSNELEEKHKAARASYSAAQADQTRAEERVTALSKLAGTPGGLLRGLPSHDNAPESGLTASPAMADRMSTVRAVHPVALVIQRRVTQTTVRIVSGDRDCRTGAGQLGVLCRAGSGPGRRRRQRCASAFA